MYKSSGDKVKRKDCQGLRLSKVKGHSDLIIDQHGRVFKNNEEMEYVGVGNANH